MAGLGLFDNVDETYGAELLKGSWHDATMDKAGWFSVDLIPGTVAAGTTPKTFTGSDSLAMADSLTGLRRLRASTGLTDNWNA